MKNFFLFLLWMIILFGNINAQIDPKEAVGTKIFPMMVVLPQSYSQVPYGIELLIPGIPNGAFDFYQVSTSQGFCESDIASSPKNPNAFVATDNRITGFVGTPWIYYTTNAGVTWGQAAISGNQGDPVFAADSLGNFYLAVLSSGVIVYKTTDYGVTWTYASRVNTNSNTDKEWIAADPTNGPYKNHVYVAFVNFATGGVVDFYRSTDNGLSWSPTGLNLGTGTPNPGPNIAVGNDGRVLTAWYNGGGTSLKISTDGGATLGATIQASAHSVPGSVNSSGRYVIKGDIRVNGNPNLAVDRSNGPHRGTIYNLYPANPPGPDACDIFITKSTDGGATWNIFSPTKVNDDLTFNDQWLPDVSVDRQGRVWAFWFDSRNDAGNNISEVWGAVSTDGGVTFSANYKLTTSFNPSALKIYQGSNHYYFGDYQGMSGESNVTMPFTYGPNNNLNNYTSYLPDYGLDFSKTIDSVNAGSTSNVRVRLPLHGPYFGTINFNATVSPSPAPGTITLNWVPGSSKVMNGNPDSILLQANTTSNVPFNLYTVTVTGTEASGARTHTRTYSIRVGNFVGVQQNSEIANEFKLEQNYPNPFNPETNVDFSIPKAGDVELKIYDILGNEVATVINEMLQPGNYTAKIDGAKLSSGIYFYRINTGSFTETKKMMIIK